MNVTQVSVFLENRAGRLASVARLLAEHDINIMALSLADTSDFGILRLVVDRSQEAVELLTRERFTVQQTDVLAIEVEDRPGGLAEVLDPLQAGGVNVEYMYAFGGARPGTVALVFRFEDPDRAMEVLSQASITVLRELTAPDPEEGRPAEG